MKSHMIWLVGLGFATLCVGCDDKEEEEIASDLDEDLIGDWWETYHTYDGSEIDPAFRYTFNSDGTGQYYCSDQLLETGCEGMEVYYFDWSVPAPSSLEIDIRPLENGSDYVADHWTYTVSGTTVEMINYDAIDYETVRHLSRTAP